LGGGPCGAAQGVTEDSDVINGSLDVEVDIMGLGGDDLIFGGDSPDSILGGPGYDVIFGGLGSDVVAAGDGDDIILIGPDTSNFTQFAAGGDDNDTFNVLVSEITSCLEIYGNSGNDMVNLVGFGPYVAITPFGVTNFEPGYIFVVDPITGGRIFIDVEPDGIGTETIYGLPTPNPVFLTDAEFNDLTTPGSGTDPCPFIYFT
jgi:Ca2+-binding RTX toxin-like protein